LVLPGEGGNDKPKLLGWAIVENQTDNDWSNVQLSLVSGRPISFIQDLYQPLYVPRPVVQPELYASLRPQTYEAGMQPDESAPAGRAIRSTAPASRTPPANTCSRDRSPSSTAPPTPATRGSTTSRPDRSA